jgi:death-on-curing protein
VRRAEPSFLTLAEVIDIHHDQIERYGGRGGIRDIRLLESAVAAPQVSAGGEYVHGDLFQMAAAYAFHICRNHAFVDGNKRTALSSALVFLELNGVGVLDPEERLFDATVGLAMGSTSRSDYAALLGSLPREA